MKQEIERAIFEGGARAQIAVDVLLPSLQKRRDQALQEMKHAYRSKAGHTGGFGLSSSDLSFIIARISVVCELDDLMNERQTAVQKMNHLDKEKLNGEHTNGRGR